MLIEKHALIREWYVYGTAHFFFGLPVCDRNVLQQTRRGDYPPAVSFEDTVSGKETGNQGLEKYWRFRRIDSRTPNWSATITAQMNVRSSTMALSPLMPLEPSVDNNRQ